MGFRFFYILLVMLLLAPSSSYATNPILLTPNSTTLQANQSDYTPSQSILEKDIIYTINTDYTYDVKSLLKLKINDQQGVDSGSQLPLEYNPDYETLNIVEAYTLKADGRKIPVTSDKIITSQASSSADAPMFNQNKVKTVVFPDTSIGDTLVLVQKSHHKPVLDKQISITEIIDPSSDIQHAKYTITAPKNLNLQLDYQGMQANHTASQSMDTWQFTLNNRKGQTPEANGAYKLTTLPHLFVSNLKNYNEVANTYYKNNLAQAKVTPEIQQQSDLITKGINPNDKTAQAQAIYNWVSSNIRYVAVYLGNGSLVPHKASDVLANRYGDCKDHVVLLESLLSAKGIESVPVLVGIGNSFYDAPKVAMMPGTFDHVITYIPKLDKYVDSTIGVAPFGTLADVENGKPALITQNSQGQGKLVTLPMQLKENRADETISIQILPNGNAEGSNQSQYQGSLDIISRQRLMSINPSLYNQVIKNYLQNTNQIGDGSLSFSDPRDLNKPFTSVTNYRLTDVFDTEESSAFVLPLGSGASFGVTPNLLDTWTMTDSRNTAMTLPNATINSTWHYKLPNNIRVTRVPKDVAFSNELADYKVNYQHKNDEITVNRVLAFKGQEALIPADKYKLMQELNTQIHRDFKRPVVYDLLRKKVTK